MAKKKEARTKMVGLSLRMEEYKALKVRADKLNMPVAGFLKVIIRQWVDSGAKLNLAED